MNIESIEQYIQHHAEFISVIIGTITAMVICWKQIKDFIVRKYKNRQKYLKNRNSIPIVLGEIQNKLSSVDDRLQNVEREIKPNGGGSMKDTLRMVKAELDAAFWLDQRPSFRSTSSGVNILANEAYCHLCGVTMDDLLKLNWRNFAEDEEQLDDYMRRWLESSKEFSQFSGKLKIKNYKNESRGEWIIKLRPLGPIENSPNNYIWHGTLCPYDRVAIEYAKNQNIPMS